MCACLAAALRHHHRRACADRIYIEHAAQTAQQRSLLSRRPHVHRVCPNDNSSSRVNKQGVHIQTFNMDGLEIGEGFSSQLHRKPHKCTVMVRKKIILMWIIKPLNPNQKYSAVLTQTLSRNFCLLFQFFFCLKRDRKRKDPLLGALCSVMHTADRFEQSASALPPPLNIFVVHRYKTRQDTKHVLHSRGNYRWWMI